MIGARFSGPVELINYHAQELFSNQNGAWKQMEDQWDKVLRGEEYIRMINGVRTVIIPVNPNPLTRTVTDVVITVTFPNTTTRRPDEFRVNFKYNGTTQPRRDILNP